MPEENQNVEEVHTVKEVHTVEEIRSSNTSAQPTKEIQSPKEPKNTVATVGMWFSIIGLIALISLVFMRLGFPMLFVGFILGIIGLFYKPRAKARVAVCIPLIVFIAIASVVCYIWSSVKTPATQFIDWAKVEFENIDEENFDNDRFNNIVNEELNNTLGSINEEELKSLLEASTGSNTLEKGAYMFFGILQEGLENSIEKYNNGYLPETNNETIKIIINKDENDSNKYGNDENPNNDENESQSDESLDNKDNTDEDSEDKDNTDENISKEENTPEKMQQENIEVFNETEKNEIEQIINILE